MVFEPRQESRGYPGQNERAKASDAARSRQRLNVEERRIGVPIFRNLQILNGK